MDDVHYQTKLGIYSISIELVDYGDRLDDYEPYWKWFIRIEDEKQQCMVEQDGPKGGYYGCIEAAIEEALEQLQHVQVLHVEDEMIEDIRKNIQKRKDT